MIKTLPKACGELGSSVTLIFHNGQPNHEDMTITLPVGTLCDNQELYIKANMVGNASSRILHELRDIKLFLVYLLYLKFCSSVLGVYIVVFLPFYFVFSDFQMFSFSSHFLG